MKKEHEILIDRPKYVEKLISLLPNADLVKIVTGVRRCGKSKLFSLFQTKLKMSYNVSLEQIISINLEDILQTREIGLILNDNKLLADYNTLIDFILPKINPNKMNYVFIDEVQLLEDWQQVANALRLIDNVDLYLTGSNAYMFSGDLANTFGGRYMEIKMQPYSFKEYYTAYILKTHPKVKTEGDLNALQNSQEAYSRYITESAFPQTVDFTGNRELINDYLLNTVYLNTIQKDIVKRFNISDTAKMDAVIRYLFDNIGSETSLRNIEKQLKASGNATTVPTIDKYIQGLLDSYLLYRCDRYDLKGKHILNGNSKYYVSDVGLRMALLGNEDRDMGHILENVVYLELLRRGYKVTVGKVDTKFVKQADGKTKRKTLEVDFVAQKPGEGREYYQVALYALDEEVLHRELASLNEINDQYPKFLLSMDYGEGDTNGIKRKNVFKWLLGDG